MRPPNILVDKLANEQERKSFAIKIFNFFALLSLFAFDVKGLIVKDYFYSLVIFIFFVATLAHYIYFFKKENIKVGSYYTVFAMTLLLVVLYIYMPESGNSILWNFVLPPLAISLLGTKKGNIVIVALIAFYVVIYLFFPGILTFKYSPSLFLRVSFIMLILSGLMTGFQLSYERLLSIIQNQLSEIKEKNEELASTEEELRQSNEELLSAKNKIEKYAERQKQLINNLGFPFVMMNYDGKIRYTNKEAKAILQSDDLEGKSFNDFFTTSEVLKILTKLQEVLDKKIVEFEISFKGKYLIVRMYPEIDENESVVAINVIFKDITELKSKELELKEKNDELISSEKELRKQNEQLLILKESLEKEKKKIENIVQNLGAGVTIVDINENFIMANERANEIFEVNNLLGHNFTEFVDAENLTKLKNETKKRINEKTTFYELNIKTLKGNKKTIRIIGVPQYDSDFNIIGSLGVISDITEAKRKEEELIRLNNELSKYYTALEQAPTSIIITDTNATIEYVNPFFLNLTGYSKQEILGKHTKILNTGLTPSETYIEMWNTITASQVWTGEFFNQMKDGSLFIAKSVIAPVFDNNGNITNYIAIEDDVTEEKMLQEAVNLKIQQQKVLFENIPAAIFLKDTYLTYQAVNKNYADMLKLDVDEMIGEKYTHFFPNERFVEETDKKIIETKQGIKDLEKFENGKWLSITKLPYFNEENEVAGIVGIIIDITQRKQRELELRKYHQAIEQSPTGIVITDKNGFVEFINSGFSKMTGFELKQLKSLTERLIKSKKIPSGHLKNLYDAIKQGKSFTGKYKMKHRKTKEIFYFQNSYSPVFNEKGEITNFIGIYTDYTELEQEKERTEILNLELEKYFTTIEQTPVGIVFIDKYGIRQYANNKYFEITGYSIEEAIGEKSSLLDDENLIMELNNGEITNKEFYREAKRSFWERLTAFPIKDDKGVVQYYVVMIEDITEQKKTEKLVLEQKEKLEIFYKEINDSINYSKAIQSQTLPDKQLLHKLFGQFLLLYKPQHIIGGDFYYANETEGFKIFAVADCTGHGIPGALISMLGFSLLHEIVTYKLVNNTAQALNLLRKQIKNIFTDYSGGMDIAIGAIDTKTNKLMFSGANRPLLIIRNKQELLYKGTRNPIGYYPVEKDFENITIDLQKDDIIYLYSDGYPDQYFIDENGKSSKLTDRRFRKILLQISDKTFDVQKKILEDLLKNKMIEKQIDDITILGIKIK